MCWVRRRKALVMTLTEDRAIAAAAMIGESRSESGVQDAGGDRDTGDVVDERKHQVLADVAHRLPGEVTGPHDAHQVPTEQGHPGALHATSVPEPIASPTSAAARAGRH